MVLMYKVKKQVEYSLRLRGLKHIRYVPVCQDFSGLGHLLTRAKLLYFSTMFRFTCNIKREERFGGESDVALLYNVGVVPSS